MVSHLCVTSGVSRSGYYSYFSESGRKSRKKRAELDEDTRQHILKAYNFKRRKKGAKQLKMTLAGQYALVYNLKRIRRIMKKYGIFCPIRKANPYRRMMKATKEHTVVPNLLNRNFRQNIPGKVLLTDITYSTPSCQRATTQQGVRHISMFGMQRSQCLRWGPALLPLREGVSRSSGDCRTLAR